MFAKYSAAVLSIYAFFACVPAYAGDSNSPTANWNGPYAGLALGMSLGKVDPEANIIQTSYFTTTDGSQVDPEGRKSLSETAINGGVMVGMNRQYGNFVVGLEADLTRTQFNESYSSGNVTYLSLPTAIFNATTKVKSDWLASVRPRVGYAHKDSLLFLSAGPALTRFNYEYTYYDTSGTPQSARVSENKLKLGWSIGVGYEHKLADDWSVKAEYLFSDFTNIVKQNNYFADFPNDGFNHKVDYTVNNVRIALVKSF